MPLSFSRTYGSSCGGIAPPHTQWTREPFRAKARCVAAQAAFSLLELIGVLAVMAILAAIVLPFLTLSIDKVVYERESISLKDFDSALQRSVARFGYITNPAKVFEQIAAELGVQASSVQTNSRGQPRFLLVDPGLQIGPTPGLPYVQSEAGWPLAPARPRLMIVTSLGPRLPGLTTNDFDPLWNSPAGVVPAASSLSTWRGKADDLRIQRINLSSRFVRLVLSQNQSTNFGRYSVAGAPFSAAVPLPSTGVTNYFFQGSVLLLFDSNKLDSKQVLIRDQSFVYDRNVWRGSLATNMFIGLDLNFVATQFLDAFPNPNAAVLSSKPFVVQAMINYFNAYRSWAEPPSSFLNMSLQTAALTAQSDMMTAISGMYAFSERQRPCGNPVPMKTV